LRVEKSVAFDAVVVVDTALMAAGLLPALVALALLTTLPAEER